MYDTGSTAFMLVCTMLVLLMTPGLAFFYGGLSRRKNVINTMFMSFMVIGIAGLTWVFVGWSLAYGGSGDNPIIGGFDQLSCSLRRPRACPTAPSTQRFSTSFSRWRSRSSRLAS